LSRVPARGLALVACLWLAPAAHALDYSWQFDLDSGQIPNGLSDSKGLGQAWMSYDVETDHLSITLSWTLLEGDLTGIHIHGPAGPDESTRTHLADVFGDESDIPAALDRRTDVYMTTLHIVAPHGGDHGGSGGQLPGELALQTLLDGNAYVIFHSSAYPEGELRGQIPVAQPVPEPGTGCLVALGLFVLARRRPARRSARTLGARLPSELESDPPIYGPGHVVRRRCGDVSVLDKALGPHS
jgi:hypothetical protein